MLASPLPLTSAPAPASLAGLTLARPVSVATGIAAIRRADLGDVEAILALIAANLGAGHLLPRTREDVTRRIGRFLVVDIEGQVAGCAELAPLSRAVAEVRSLVVDEGCRGRGFGTRLVEELKRWAIQDGFSTVCAFTHHASHFVRLGFSIVPHQWLPEKIATDCAGCPKFRQCAQFAMALPLRGRSLRTTPAGQRPYLALPEVFASVLPEPPQVVRAIVPMPRAGADACVATRGGRGFSPAASQALDGGAEAPPS